MFKKIISYKGAKCDSPETIWFRTLKCASSSIETVLKKVISFNIIGSHVGLKRKLSKHNQVAPQATQRVVGMINFDKTWKWTFVRNPWDRAVSNYFYRRQQLDNIISKYPHIKDCPTYKGEQYVNMTFKDYLKTPFSNLPFTIKLHGRPLCYYLFGNNSFKIDFIGRYENLQNGFDYVCEKLGVQTCKLPHEKKTKHKHYTEYYDDECIELVAKKFADDIEYFGYTFT